MADTRVYTAAGTQIAISATLPTAHDIAGFEALSFTNIGEVIDGGSGGKSFNMVDYSPLAEREVLSLKGSFTQGVRELQMGRDLIDAGQKLLVEALDSDLPVAFKITFSNGDVNYIIATVNSYTDDIGTIDSVVTSSVSISQRRVTIRLFVTGVLTVSIGAGGTFTGSDGDYSATQASTSGSGTGATFIVTITTGAITAVKVVNTGTGYAATDTIVPAVSGVTETVAASITVDSIVTA